MVEYALRDSQDRAPDAYCVRCEGELWGREAEPDGFGHVVCASCRAVPKYDADTVTAVLEAMDKEVSKYLSKDLRDGIWNELVQRFQVTEAS